MDALAALSGHWRIAFGDSRARLQKQLHGSVSGQYAKFYNDQKQVPFSKKHTSTYMRYTPDLVDGVLTAMFE